MNTEELLQREDQAWTAFVDAFAAVPDDRRDDEGVVPGWSTKDLVWHCGYWAGYVGEALEAIGVVVSRRGAGTFIAEGPPDLGIEPGYRMAAVRKVLFPPTGTIHCSALNEKGEMSGITTTSGLAYKLPGRLGDSPVIGAGCYTDQDVGSAGATGSGEENIRVAGAHTIVENMRHGMSPLDAGMDALKRIVRNYGGDKSRLRFMDMTYYILRRDGAYAGVSLWEGYEPGNPHRIAVHDGTRRAEATVPLFEGVSQEFPPFPKVPEERLEEIR